MSKPATVRTHVLLPKAMLKAIDGRVGRRRRSQFMVEVLDRELKRQGLIDLFERPGALLDASAHPEWKDGSAEWVREMRQQDLSVELARRARTAADARVSS